jgi:hypothetical protein
MGEKGIEIVYGEGKKYFVLGRLQSSQGRTKISFTSTTRRTNQSKKGPLSFDLSESPFTSVSAVSRGHPSLVSLALML